MRIGIFIEDLFDEQEFIYPLYRVQEAGFEALVIGPEVRKYHAKDGFGRKSDKAAEQVKAKDLAGLIIPGGYAPDKMRRYPSMLQLVQTLNADNKPIGSICHASWVIISANIVRGRKVTGHPSTRDDLVNAGAHYSEERVVVDNNLITAQHYLDLPGFMQAFLRAFPD